MIYSSIANVPGHVTCTFENLLPRWLASDPTHPLPHRQFEIKIKKTNLTYSQDGGLLRSSSDPTNPLSHRHFEMSPEPSAIVTVWFGHGVQPDENPDSGKSQCSIIFST
jgi:hypothetical protein